MCCQPSTSSRDCTRPDLVKEIRYSLSINMHSHTPQSMIIDKQVNLTDGRCWGKVKCDSVYSPFMVISGKNWYPARHIPDMKRKSPHRVTTMRTVWVCMQLTLHCYTAEANGILVGSLLHSSPVYPNCRLVTPSGWKWIRPMLAPSNAWFLEPM